MFVPQTLVARDGNAALDLNPPNADEHITTGTSDWLWAAFSLVTLCLVFITGFTFMVSSVSERDLYLFC
jgi:bacteriorhodopsin